MGKTVDPWLPLDEVLEILYKYNPRGVSYIGSDIKYVSLRIDTRDMCCLVRGRDGNNYDSLEQLEEYAKKWHRPRRK